MTFQFKQKHLEQAQSKMEVMWRTATAAHCEVRVSTGVTLQFMFVEGRGAWCISKTDLRQRPNDLEFQAARALAYKVMKEPAFRDENLGRIAGEITDELVRARVKQFYAWRTQWREKGLSRPILTNDNVWGELESFFAQVHYLIGNVRPGLHRAVSRKIMEQIEAKKAATCAATIERNRQKKFQLA